MYYDSWLRTVVTPLSVDSSYASQAL